MCSCFLQDHIAAASSLSFLLRSVFFSCFIAVPGCEHAGLFGRSVHGRDFDVSCSGQGPWKPLVPSVTTQFSLCSCPSHNYCISFVPLQPSTNLGHDRNEFGRPQHSLPWVFLYVLGNTVVAARRCQFYVAKGCCTAGPVCPARMGELELQALNFQDTR